MEEEYGYHTHTAESFGEESIRGEGTKGVRMDVKGCEEKVPGMIDTQEKRCVGVPVLVCVNVDGRTNR